MLEKDIEHAVTEWWREQGYLTTKLNGQGQRGKPDRVFWIPGGKPAIIEFKKPGQEPSDLQLYWLKQFERHGYRTAWFDDAELAKAYLKAFMR